MLEFGSVSFAKVVYVFTWSLSGDSFLHLCPSLGHQCRLCWNINQLADFITLNV